jgi:integrase
VVKSETSRTHIKGQGSLFKDPRSPYWQLSYWNGWRQVRESARTADRREALELLNQKLSHVSIQKRSGTGPEQIKVETLLTLLIDEYRRQDKADLYITELRVRKHLSPKFGRVKACKLTSRDIREYIEFRKEKASNATINRELSILRRAYNLGTLEDPPLVSRVPRITKLKEDNVREGFIEHQQYRTILDLLPAPLQPVFVVAYHLGMRKGELLKIRRDWVDLEAGMIFVNGRVTKNGKPKTVPIYGEMRGWVDMALARCKLNSPKSKYLFVWEDGSPIRDFRGSWEQACEIAGVPGLLFHDLRRTAVRNLIRAGISEKVAMAISGHKTASMLWRYNITDTRDIKEAGRRMQLYLEQLGNAQPTEKPTEYLNVKPS